MKSSFLNNILPVLLALTLFGCKARKEARPAATPPVNAPAVKETSAATEAIIRNVSAHLADFKTFSGKAKANLSIGNNDNDVNMNIRVKKDEVIWVSVTAFAGIEVARALITPDSLKVLNRLQGIYLARPFNYVHRFANKQISFASLQAILVGNPVPGTLNADAEAQTLGEQTKLSGKMKGLLFSLLFNNENKLLETNMKDAATNQTVVATYGGFQNISGIKVPAEIRLVSSAQNKPVEIELKYSSISLNENLEFPFSVPKKFTVQ
ncbi:DUF4292 domain-containing protein [Arcticibacter sp. MXS-1]|uniref:DUF4292 domain-containing protein n=1 Tax=Arcticibacter sp. MXS-1 TaxID=3341726 RepID=UPI0035A8D8B6